MKIEEGMYVRTKHGIRKIVKIDEDDTCYIDKYYINGFRQEIWCIPESCIIGEPSFDIIDLIEEGDYVNGSLVSDITGEYLRIDDESHNKHYFSKYIKSIVTKEQFESVSYKVK